MFAAGEERVIVRSDDPLSAGGWHAMTIAEEAVGEKVTGLWGRNWKLYSLHW